MMDTRKIIVGVDGSEGSHRAVYWAADEAVRSGRELVITCAYDFRPPVVGWEPDGGYIDELRQVGESVVAASVRDAVDHAPGVNARGEVVPGSPGSVLVERGPRDLVVVGNRGRGGFVSLILGSVGHQVVTHAMGTVVVVRGRHNVCGGPVVVGVDLEHGDTALSHAFEEAQLREARLVAIHVRRPFDAATTHGNRAATSGVLEGRDASTGVLRDLVSGWAAKYPDVSVETSVIDGHVAGVLAALSEAAQLVVVGHRGHGHGHVGLGAVAAQLVHHAECPVMIVRGCTDPA
jgi:nucleotide-binding universal stress UspA family protein